MRSMVVLQRLKMIWVILASVVLPQSAPTASWSKNPTEFCFKELGIIARPATPGSGRQDDGLTGVPKVYDVGTAGYGCARADPERDGTAGAAAREALKRQRTAKRFPPWRPIFRDDDTNLPRPPVVIEVAELVEAPLQFVRPAALLFSDAAARHISTPAEMGLRIRLPRTIMRSTP